MKSYKFVGSDQRLEQALKAGKEVDSDKFCKWIFPRVSRTFAINVIKLSPTLSFRVLVSYLLCRIADTVEDDARFSSLQKDTLLKQFTALLSDEKWEQNVKDFTQTCSVLDSSKPDVYLTLNTYYVLKSYFKFPPDIREHITKWVSELSLGMAEYSLRQQENQVTFLKSIADLEKYCYYVAGTVGHLLNGLFYKHYSCIDQDCYERLEKNATSFGLGLQMTNIIKDSIIDQERNWCYLPEDLLMEKKLTNTTFFSLENREISQQIMFQIIMQAKKHLDNALAYSCALPKRAMKVRIFCFLPLLMAIKTLGKAVYSEQLFTPDNPVKISRAEVAEIIRYTYFNCWSNSRMEKWYRRVGQSLEKAQPHKKRA